MLVYCKDNLAKVNIQKLKLEDNGEKELEEEFQAEQIETDSDSDAEEIRSDLNTNFQSEKTNYYLTQIVYNIYYDL